FSRDWSSDVCSSDLNRPVAEIESELNVEGVPQGSVERAGDRSRGSVRLLRADASVLWSQEYDWPSADFVKVSGEISARVADTARVPLTETERRALTQERVVTVRAQDAFLRGLQRLND